MIWIAVAFRSSRHAHTSMAAIFTHWAATAPPPAPFHFRAQILGSRLYDQRLRLAAMTAVPLLGWSGGGFIGVGRPLFVHDPGGGGLGGPRSLAGRAAMVHRYRRAGAAGAYVVPGWHRPKFEWQQFIFGLLILPMVALYARRRT